MPPKLAYDWDSRRDVCYDLYIAQNKPLDDVISHLRDGDNFIPSKRAFQARFREWGFPQKHHRAHKEASLAARIRQLWEVNTPSKEMFNILRGEGWDIKERELTKLRKEYGLFLREANKNEQGKKRKRSALGEVDENGQPKDAVSTEPPVTSSTPELSAEILAKRAARQAKLQAESDQRLKDGTRRRRTKGWAGLPPDPISAPRFPSELTMEECKTELGLDKAMYHEMRCIFEEICRANNIIKKTLCPADAWRSAKETLIGRFPHLQPFFWGPATATINQTQKPMALDLICMDTTKKLRTVNNRVTITDAKGILSVTPQQSRDLRTAFNAILKGDHFTSKLEVPKGHWEGLKQKWIDESPLLQEKLADPDADPHHAAKLRSLESIACDVVKRHRDEQTRKDPTHLRKTVARMPNSHSTPGTSTSPNTAPTSTFTQSQPPTLNPAPALAASPATIPPDGMTALASQALASYSPTPPPLPLYSTLQIDPNLLHAARLPQPLPQPQTQPQESLQHAAVQMQEAIGTPPYSSGTELGSGAQTQPQPPPIPVYFRLSPSSTLYPPNHPLQTVWLDKFHHPYTLSRLRDLALVRSGMREIKDVRVGKIEGVEGGGGAGGGGGGGGESRWGIDEDDEVGAYLEMVLQGKGRGKAVFVVEIEGV